MTADNYVSEMLVVADGNPRPGVAHFPSYAAVGQGRRRRRAFVWRPTQNIIVVAKTSDGKFFTDRKQVKVTIGGCGG